MFQGRARELAELERLYTQGGFQMVVLYGRRRVGKTTLVREFAKDKPSLFYTAKVQSDALNLAGFSRELYKYAGLPVTSGTFASWDDAFAFLAKVEDGRRLVFMFDEFPYAAAKNEGLVSTLQIAVDHLFFSTDVFFILTGSNQGFMEEKVLGAEGDAGESGLGEKNPLFGRRTAQIHLAPFGYRDAAKMLPGLEPSDLVRYYACFGGTPYYLSLIDCRTSFEDNVTRLFFRKEGLLYEEPMMLLRQELREPALYSSVLGAIASGANTPTLIADRVGIERTSLSKYLNVLSSLYLVEKAVPYGEDRLRSRKGIYRLTEPCFAYWYRFVEPYIDEIEQDAGELAAREVLSADEVSTYVGHWFEAICREWTIEQAKQGLLPLTPIKFGSWWGTNPVTRAQDDIDLIAGNPKRGVALLGECKWRERVDETQAMEKLHARSAVLKGFDDFFYALFTKHGASSATRKKYADEKHLFISAADLYAD